MGQGSAKYLGKTMVGTRVVHQIFFESDGRQHQTFVCSLTDDCVGIVKNLESLQVLLKEIDSKDKKPPPLLSLNVEIRQRLSGKAFVMRWSGVAEEEKLREYATITQEGIAIYTELPAKELAGQAWKGRGLPGLSFASTIRPKVAKVDERTVRYSFPIPVDDEGAMLILGFGIWAHPEFIWRLGK